MSRLLIRNARLVNEGEIREVNRLVRDGRIARIAPAIDACADDEIDAAGHFPFEILGELLDARSIGLRLEVVGQAMCPRLHVDRVGIRLLCTYRGPGTEWVDDVAVDRGRLGARARGLPDENSGLLGPGSRIEIIPPFAVALLKGSLWQGNGGRGVIHRSPAVTPGETPRILLAMDADW
jgi:hypothetical protein